MSHEEAVVASIVENLNHAIEEDQPTTAVSVSTDRYPFDIEYQQQIAALCVRSQSFVRRTHGLIKPDYFESVHQAILVNICLSHFENYKQLPKTGAEWLMLLKEAKSNRLFREEMTAEMVEALRTLKKLPLPVESQAVDRCAEFARHQAIQQSMFKAMSLLESGKHNDMDKASKMMRQAFDVGAADAVDDIDYGNDIERRTEERKALADGTIRRRGISTGFKKLDNRLYHKGWGRSELTAFMAGAKMGKSQILGDICARTWLQGLNVLYVSLELSKDIIAARIDANISDTPIGDIEDSLFAVRDKVQSVSGKTKGNFRIVEYPPESFKPSMLRRALERYRAEDIQFDLIAVDYADIMAPEFQTSDPIENSKSIWLALRSIAMEEDCVMLTATQTNRSGHKATTSKSTDVATDFNKIRIADLVISINADDDEIIRGEARLFFAASRNQAGDFSLMVKRDLSRGQAIKSVHNSS